MHAAARPMHDISCGKSEKEKHGLTKQIGDQQANKTLLTSLRVAEKTFSSSLMVSSMVQSLSGSASHAAWIMSFMS